MRASRRSVFFLSTLFLMGLSTAPVLARTSAAPTADGIIKVFDPKLGWQTMFQYTHTGWGSQYRNQEAVLHLAIPIYTLDLGITTGIGWFNWEHSNVTPNFMNGVDVRWWFHQNSPVAIGWNVQQMSAWELRGQHYYGSGPMIVIDARAVRITLIYGNATVREESNQSYSSTSFASPGFNLQVMTPLSWWLYDRKR